MCGSPNAENPKLVNAQQNYLQITFKVKHTINGLPHFILALIDYKSNI